MRDNQRHSRRHRAATWLVGIRKGFGDGSAAIMVARDSEKRRLINWALPGLGIIFGIFLLIFHEVTSFTDNMLFRVFVFDYCLFLFGGLSGWNMARRWRANADQIEEISLTSLSPGTVGTLLLIGPTAIWLRLFALFALIDFSSPFAHIRSYTGMMAELGIDSMSLSGFALGAIIFLTHLILVIVMNWFHFESVRLAHWMFAIHSLPKISLLGAGIKNFISMTAIVAGLSALGSAITGMMMVAAMIVFSVVPMMFDFGISYSADYLFTSYSVWGLASIGGALLVIVLKRQLCKTYERSFAIAWLQYQWWGAGESRQPSAYPMHFRGAFPLWLAYYGMEEEEAANIPLRKRRHHHRYHQYVQRYKFTTLSKESDKLAPALPGVQLAVNAGNSSGSPSQSPDRHSEPLHNREHSDGTEQSLESR